MDFSVLMSVYYRDNPHYLRESLDSLLLQTIQSNDIVLVKDGPLTSELDSVLSSFELKLPVRVIELEKNSGLGHALSIGIMYCRNEIISRMDADDICVSDRFEKQVSFLLNNPDYDLVGSNIEEFVNTPGDLGIIKVVPQDHENIVYYSRKRSPFNHPSVTFRKSAIIKAGSYKSMISFEDYYLWLRLIKTGRRFYNIQEPLLYFRIGDNMLDRRRGWKYALQEFKFLKTSHDEGLISTFDFFRSILIRFPSRLLPIAVLRFIYGAVLR